LPRLSCYMVRSALIHLGVGFAIGGLMLAHKAVFIHPAVPALLSWHIHALFFGWTIQFAFGIAYWIFPRLTSWGFRHPRGWPGFAWAAFILVNLGVMLAGPGALVAGRLGGAAGTLAELLAALAFGLHLWPRLRPPLPQRGAGAG
jgi:hypothetical protein